MPSPRVFISSTYVDLVDVRSVVSDFFKELMFETVEFERGGIFFDPGKPLDLSCYEAVKDCDMMVLVIGGRYGSPASDSHASTDGHSFNSVTKMEYLEALSAGIPIYTFVRQKVLNEYYTFANQPKHQRKKFRPATVDNLLVFQLIQEILDLKTQNIVQYETVIEIIEYLKKANANLIHDAIKSQKSYHDDDQTLINGYKLFYFRRKQGFSHSRLSSVTRLKRNFLTALESVRTPKSSEKYGEIFRTCSKKQLKTIEKVLECPGKLEAGKSDDLLSMYIQYYHCNRGKPPVGNGKSSPNPVSPLFPIKCVIFDFDGTLTRQNDRTTWERIWERLGYTVEDCARLHRDYTNKVITHDEWCIKTCEAFNRRGISEATLREVASTIELMPGTRETLNILQSSDIEMHILSGSIEQIISNVLGTLAPVFTHIQANSFKFTGSVLSYIQGTQYDFEGKATYVSQLMQRRGLSQLEVLFVGNSSNDRWVSRSGVTTLCVNPHFTDGNDAKEWLYCIREMHDLREILKFIGVQSVLE